MIYNSLTRIEAVFVPQRMNQYVRFGRPVCVRKLHPGQRYEYYVPRQIVGYVLWRAGSHGSRLWRFIILKTTCRADGESTLQEVPGVVPGAEILLDLEGAFKVRKLLHMIDGIAALGLDPVDVSPAYYTHLHHRITTNMECHTYSMQQHQAFQKRQEISK